MTEQQLIKLKKSLAAQELQKIFDHVWSKILDLMSKSPNIYPKVSIFWNSKEPLKLKVDCDGKLSFVSVPAIHISSTVSLKSLF